MRKLSVAAIALVSLTALSLVAARPATDGAAESVAVREAVEHYFAGMMKASPATLRMAFHPEARLIGTKKDGGLMVIPFDRWASSWDGRAPLDPKTFVNRIVSVDVSGTAASVKTDLTWPDVRYIDYLSLLKVDGEWRIVNKIWTEQ